MMEIFDYEVSALGLFIGLICEIVYLVSITQVKDMGWETLPLNTKITVGLAIMPVVYMVVLYWEKKD